MRNSKVFIYLFLFIIASCSEDKSIIEEITIQLSVQEITSGGVDLSAILSRENQVKEQGFCWSEVDSIPTKDDFYIKVDRNGINFSTTLKELKSGIAYYLRAYAMVGTEMIYSELKKIKIPTDVIYLLSPNVTNIDEKEVLLASTIENLNNILILEKGFVYSSIEKKPEIGIDNVQSIVSKIERIDSISNKVTFLTSNTLYYVRSYIKQENRFLYSDIITFRTKRSEEDELLENFIIPTYLDDYSLIAGWDKRHLWNLANVHDPTVEKCGDYYYMYTTDASYGNTHDGYGHFPYRRSKDLVDWDFQGMAMKKTPEWVKDTLNNMRSRLSLDPIETPHYGHWAPVVRKVGNKYRMYYSIVIDNYIQTGKYNVPESFDNSWIERAFIGMQETDDLASNIWEDKGMVICSSTDKEKDWSRPSLNNWEGYFKWNAIDPSYIKIPTGDHWLVYGSWHSGIVAVQIDRNTGKPLRELREPWDKNSLPNYGKQIYTRNKTSRWQASEAPEIIYNKETGYYYLFLAYDELSVAYNTRVCRSKNIDGPYKGYNSDRDLSNDGGNCFPIITHPYKFNNHSGWVGISHCCVFEDGQGNWFFASQGRLPHNTGGNEYSNAIMMGHVRKIRWTDEGWPVVMPERYAGVPNICINDSDLIGVWEHIVLSYKYGTQSSSQRLVLATDYKAYFGNQVESWSYDAQNKILTIGSIELCVEREVDWEATPRKVTIVYAGLNSEGVSLWGKKVIE